MGEYAFSGENGALRVATAGLWTPMSFYMGQTLTGEFIEIINGFCAAYGYTPQYATVTLTSGLAGLAAGTYDIYADSVTISEERLDTICITDALMTDDYYLLVKREPVMTEVPKASLFFRNIGASIRRTFITEERYKILLSGLGVTVMLSLIAGVLGTLLGVAVCYLRMRRNGYVRAFASLYIRIFRSLPVVVLLLVLNYIVLRNAGLSAFWICAITFSIEFSAYCSEIFRSGINAVPSGQARAATALGFGKLQTFQSVILPQAIIHFLPPYSGQFIATVKMTAVAGYISVIDLTKASDIIRSRTYEAFFPLFFIDEGIIYEEGTPKEIFDAPKRDKTRQFINRLQVYETTIRGAAFNPIEQLNGIEQFALCHMISRRLVNEMLTVEEELCIQIILPMLGNDGEIRLVFEYDDADGGSVNMKAAYDGLNLNPLEAGDGVSLALTRLACQDLNWQHDGGRCVIGGKLKHNPQG